MAIATNASSLTSSGGFANSLAISHTVAGTDRLLLVGVHCRSAVADVTGVDYGGTPLTLIGSNENTGVVGVQWYSLTAPAAGTANVNVALANFRLFSVIVYSLTGVDQTTPIEASDFSTLNLDGFGTGLSTSITTTTNGARIVTLAATKDDASPFTAGGSASLLQSGDDPDASLGSEALQILDVPTAGSTAYSLNWTTSTNWRGATLVIRPMVAVEDPEYNDVASDVVNQMHVDAAAFARLYGFSPGLNPNFAAVGETPRCLGDNRDAAIAVYLQQFALPWHSAYDTSNFNLNEAGAVINTLTADAGTYALTGVSAGFDRSMAAAQGTYAQTGVAAGLRTVRVLTAAQGTYNQTGNAAGLNYSGGSPPTYSLTAAQGTYAQTGNDVTLRVIRKLVSAQGTYAQTGVAAGLMAVRKLVSAQGTYAQTGVAAGLSAVRKLVSAQGTYTQTGVAAALTRTRALVAGVGAYALTGVDARLSRPITRFAAAFDTYATTGYDIVLTRYSFGDFGQTYVVPAEKQVFAAGINDFVTLRISTEHQTFAILTEKQYFTIQGRVRT